MSHYNRNRRTVREETRGELDFSESERIYGRSTYINKPSSFYREPHSIEERQYPRGNNFKYRYDGGQNSYMRQRNDNRVSGTRNLQTRGRVPRIQHKEGVQKVNERRNGSERDRYSQNSTGRMYSTGGTLNNRNNSNIVYSRGTRVPHERYYVRETIKEEPEEKKQESEEEDAIVCCCGCVEVVDSIYCSGMKMFRCRHDNEKDEEDKQNLTKTWRSYRERDERLREQQQRYLMYRRSDPRYFSEDDESDGEFTESETGTDPTYDEIPTRTREILTYEKPQNSNVYNKMDVSVAKSSTVKSRPISGGHQQNHYTIRQRNIHSAPPQKRHVGAQMTTKYVVQEQRPQKKIVRNVNTQTVSFEQEVIPSPRHPKQPVVKKEEITHCYSPPSPPRHSPPPRPKYIGDKPSTRHYKTAVIDIGENNVDEEGIIVVPSEPPRTVIEAPKQPKPEPEPEPEIIWIHEYKPEPEVIMEPIYDPLPVEPLPLPIKIEPIFKDVQIDPFVQKESKKNIKFLEPKPQEKKDKEHLEPIIKDKPQTNVFVEEVIQVFTKGTTALFRALPKPTGKCIMVRVGGGWMKVEHHRNHHMPLAVQEHHREANKDKYLYIKSKFVTNQKNVPIAYKKYREKVIKQGA